MAVLATEHRSSAAKERQDRRRSNVRPSAAAEECSDRRGRNGHPTSPAEDLSDRRGRNGKQQARISAIASYETLKRIGEGAYGAVTKARHLESGEIVAIKSSNVDDAGGEAEAAALLLREAAMLAACAGNPAVVRLREVARGPDMRELYLVMEYGGRSLSDAIRSRRRCGQRCFSEPEARGAMAQLLAGASTMHAHGVIHRDLKPGNVLVGDKDGRLRFCDLGLARPVVAPPADDVDGLQGTLGYMAPELLLSQDYGAPVDVWALGCIMAEMVAGEPLFAEEDLCQHLISIVHLLGISDDVSLMPLGVSSPSKLRERVPEELLSPAGFDALQGLLEYDPKDRLTADAALNMPWFAAKDDA